MPNALRGASAAPPCARTRRARGGAARAALAEPPPLVDTVGTLSRLTLWEDPARPRAPSKRLQTQVAPVAAGTTVIRCLDGDRDRFDIEFGLSDGTTYNSYVVQGGDKVALVDTSHAKFGDLYLAALRGVLDPARIDYLVVSHTEPDHSGLVAPLLALAPNAVVVGSRVCLQFLANLVLTPFKSLEVKAGSVIDLGGGHELEFVPAPNLHWPDTMFSFDRATGVLFTCDAFGAHYCSPAVFDDSLEALAPHYAFYYECLMKPNARSVLTALRKVEGLAVRVVATGHGPVLARNVAELTGRYAAWSSSALAKATSSALLLYCADYGYADRLGQSLARGLTKTGAEVVMLDAGSADEQEVADALGRAGAVVLLAPPSPDPAAPAGAAATGGGVAGAAPAAARRASRALAALFAGVKPGTRVLLAESYGGRDEPVDTLRAALLAAGADVAARPLRVTDVPGEAVYQAYEEAGTDLGQALGAKDARRAQKEGMAPAVAKALGRLSGGLYLSAMVASWVAQAGFEPPSLTVAVAKDRAIERLLQVGDAFVLNCLPEGPETAPVMKHFLQRFPPGGDRFAGVAWAPAPGCGSPVLERAVAYVECAVTARMEAADHWVVLATVRDGAVLRPDVKTAVHRRKIGSYY